LSLDSPSPSPSDFPTNVSRSTETQTIFPAGDWVMIRIVEQAGKNREKAVKLAVDAPKAEYETVTKPRHSVDL